MPNAAAFDTPSDARVAEPHAKAIASIVRDGHICEEAEKRLA